MNTRPEIHDRLAASLKSARKSKGLSFAAGGRLVSDPHRPGCREHLTVLEGVVQVVSGADRQTLAAGDTARCFADRPHRIEAEGGPARAVLIVQNS